MLSLPWEVAAQNRGSVCLHLPASPNCSHDLNTFTLNVLTLWEKEVIKFAGGCAGGTKQTARIKISYHPTFC